jgi:hypothetical protein
MIELTTHSWMTQSQDGSLYGERHSTESEVEVDTWIRSRCI